MQFHLTWQKTSVVHLIPIEFGHTLRVESQLLCPFLELFLEVAVNGATYPVLMQLVCVDTTVLIFCNYDVGQQLIAYKK